MVLESAMTVVIWLFYAFVVLFYAFVVFAVYVWIAAWYYLERLGPAIEKDLGFKDGSACLRVGRGYHSAVALQDVDPQGVLGRSGARTGDVLPGMSHIQLFQYLHRHRGCAAELKVVDAGEGPLFYLREPRFLRFDVPAISPPIERFKDGMKEMP